jgi:hypothetical protein
MVMLSSSTHFCSWDRLRHDRNNSPRVELVHVIISDHNNMCLSRGWTQTWILELHLSHDDPKHFFLKFGTLRRDVKGPEKETMTYALLC